MYQDDLRYDIKRSIMSMIAAQPNNIVARRRKDCAQLFILFKGAVGKFMMMEPMRFLAETDLLSRNLVMIRDPHKSFYQCGVSETIGDFDALVEWLAAYRNDLPQVSEGARNAFPRSGLFNAAQDGDVLEAEVAGIAQQHRFSFGRSKLVQRSPSA